MPDLHDAFEGLRDDLEGLEAPHLLPEAIGRAPSRKPPEPRTPWRRLGTVAAALAIAIASTLFMFRAFERSETPASDTPRLPYPLAYTGAEVPDPHWTEGQLWLMDQSGQRTLLSADPGDGVTPAWSPDGSQIAFDARFDPNGSDQIWVVNADGGGLHQLTNMFPMNGDAINDSPAWSPDGSQIAFNCFDGVSNHELCLVNADGSHPQKLTDGVNTAHDTAPIWFGADELMFSSSGSDVSGTYVIRTDGTGLQRIGTARLQMTLSPDASTIAFTCPTKGGNAICVETTDLTDRRQISQPPTDLPGVATSDAFPAWLPDGRLSFLRTSDLAGFDGYHLYVVDPTGGDATELMNLGEDVRGLAWGGISKEDPSTGSPEPSATTPSPAAPIAGARILFTVRDDADGSEDVYTMAADGSDVRPLLTGPEDDSDAVWSPDGTKVAFVRLDRNGPCTDSNIYVAAADASHQVRLTGSPADLQCEAPSAAPGTNVIVGVGVTEDEPAWSPDGSHIALRSNACGIMVVSVDGSGSTCLTAEFSYAAEPVWSPDGSRIAFDSDEGLASDAFGTDIWVMAADGSHPVQVTHDGGGNIVTDWSPDGTLLAYERSVNRSDYSWDVWTVNVDGSDPRQLTDWPGSDGNAIFAPDGRSIVFASDRFGDAHAIQQGENGGYAHGLDVYVMSIDGGEVVRLTTYAPLTAWPSNWAAFER